MSSVAPGVALEPGLLWTRKGQVQEFSDDEGIGIVVGSDGALHRFHCTAIADGSRRIEPGTDVSFVLVAGHLGRFEARDLVPILDMSSAAQGDL